MQRGVELTVLTWNIHHGVGADGRLRLDRIARVIARSGADLVALQEVEDGWGPRSRGIDQAAWLGRSLGMTAVLAAARTGRDGARNGNALLARPRVLRHAAVPLPPQALAASWPEPRVLLDADVDLGPAQVRIGLTHLDPGSARLRQEAAEVIAQHLGADHGCPTIVLGDMNTGTDARALRALDDAGLRVAGRTPGARSPRTFPAPLPVAALDQIRVSADIGVQEVRVLPEPWASDHRPLRARLTIGL